MDRYIFGRKTANKHPWLDRFIAPRESVVEMRRRHSWEIQCRQETIDVWHIEHQQQKKYRSCLDAVFDLQPLRTNDLTNEEKWCVQTWPCVPRKKRYLSSADSILDLPAYSYASFPELLDWSSRNILVAALGTHYHMFSWNQQKVTGHGVTPFGIHCCKFDPRGDLLLIGSDMQTVELHDSVWSKCVSNSRCQCLKEGLLCSVTAVDWSPTGNSFVAGCSNGVVSAFDRRSMLYHKWRGGRSAMLAVRISPDSRYVAVAAVNSSSIHVLIWPSLKHHSSLSYDWTVKALTWHPWRSALLAVGAITYDLQTYVALWDTPAAKLRKTAIGHNHYIIDVMLFSHMTGELVLSLWDRNIIPNYLKYGARLVVMSDPNTVVDQSEEAKNGLDRVRTMVFSPDGTKLATATADEDLIIWNFLPEDNKRVVNPRNFSAIPAYLDQITQGFVLR